MQPDRDIIRGPATLQPSGPQLRGKAVLGASHPMSQRTARAGPWRVDATTVILLYWETSNDHGGAAMKTKKESETPPLLTASWIRTNAGALTQAQRDGKTCVYCGAETTAMVPVGFLGA